MGDIGDDMHLLLHQIYISLPFMLELRTLLDWSFTKTSLDINQWLQLNQYHSDFHIAKVSNYSYYNDKEVGDKISGCEKCLCGGILTSIILFFLIGPFLLFSSSGVLSAYNSVTDAKFTFDLVVNNSETFGKR
jgi:hypothetical protein